MVLTIRLAGRVRRVEVRAMWPEVHGDNSAANGARPSGGEDGRCVTDVVAAAVQGLDFLQVPAALCRACVKLLPVTGASVSLTSQRTVNTLWCASDERATRLAEAQYTLGDGPCQAAFDQTAPVLASDLTGGPDALRWPVFAQQALELGVRAVFSLPLGVGALAVGTLDLYRESTGALSERELRIALMVRDAVTFSVLHLQSDTERHGPGDEGGAASWVEAAEADHAEVYQAVGMVMAQLGLDPQQALDRLRARAFTQGCSVTELARDVVSRAVRFSAEADEGQEHGRRGTANEGR